MSLAIVIPLVVLLVLLFCFIVWGLVYKPILDNIVIYPNTGKGSKSCKNQPVSCNTDAECGQCTESIEGESMVCKTLTRYKNPDGSQGPYGNDIRVCVPETATSVCDTTYGGMEVWSGWSDPSRQEWDCLCGFPEYASSSQCDSKGVCNGTMCNLNPNVCAGGVFSWTASSGVPPSADLCTCGAGKTKVLGIVEGVKGVPMCVDPENARLYNISTST